MRVRVWQVWQVNVLQSLLLSLSIKSRKKRNTCHGSVWGPQTSHATRLTASCHCCCCCRFLPTLTTHMGHNSRWDQHSQRVVALVLPCNAVAAMVITITVSSASIAIAHSACSAASG